MDNQLEPIYQNIGEDDFEFIQRAVKTMKDQHTKRSLNFQDGIVLSTYEYDLEDHLTPNILFAAHKLAQPLELGPEITEPLTILTDAAKKKSTAGLHTDKIRELEEKIADMETKKAAAEKELAASKEKDFAHNQAHIDSIYKSSKKKQAVILNSMQRTSNEIKNLEKDLKEQQEKSIAPQKSLEEILQKFEAAKANPKTSKEEMFAIMQEKEKLEWEVDAYNEYITFVEEELAKLKADQELNKQRVDNIAKEARESMLQCQEELEMKYGKSQEINGKKVSRLEDAPILVTMTQSIEEVKAKLAYYKRNPEEIERDIIAAMQAGEPVRKVQTELDLLTSILDGPTVPGVLNHSAYGSTEEQIIAVVNQEKEVQARLEKNDYFKTDEMVADNEEIRLIEKEVSDNQQLIDERKEKLEIYEEQRNIRTTKASLKKILKSIEINKEQQAFLSSYDTAGAQKYEDILASLETQKRNLEAKIEKATTNAKIFTPGKIQREIEKYELIRDNAKATIAVIRERDYTDYEAREKDRKLLEALQEKRTALEEKQKYLGNQNVEELKQQILNKYQKPQNIEKEEIEEIVNYEEIKPTLRQRIHLPEFMKKAGQAFANLTSRRKNSTLEEVTVNNQTNSLEGELEEQVLEDSNMNTSPIAPEEINENINQPERTINITQPQKEGNNNVEKTLPSNNAANPATIDATAGKLYAISPDGNPVEINLQDAENYINNGYNVAATYSKDAGGIGYMNVEEPSRKR